MYVPAEPILTPRLLFGKEGSGCFLGDLDKSKVILFTSGRSAFWGALQTTLRLDAKDSIILLPAYLCNSLMAPLHSGNIKYRFYQVRKTLYPDLEDLIAKIDAGVRAILIIHYFGFPSFIEEVRNISRKYNLYLIEDCAHALFSKLGTRPLGAFGHLSIFSLRKSLPLPDGGALILNDKSLQCEKYLRQPDSKLLALKMAYLILKSVEAFTKCTPRTLLLQIEQLRLGFQKLDSNPIADYDYVISTISQRIMKNVFIEDIIAKRRKNFSFLLREAEELTWLKPIFSKLPPGVCPLGFPMLVERREYVRTYLLKRGIHVRAYWDVLPSEIEPDRFPDSKYLSDRIIVLPVHQNIHHCHLQKMIKVLRELELELRNG